MKEKVFGTLFWGFIFGALIVGTAAVFLIGMLRDVQDEVKTKKPIIAAPPTVGFIVPTLKSEWIITLAA